MNTPAVKKHRGKQKHTPLPSTDREQIIAAVARHGRSTVIREFMRLDPYRERHAADAMLRKLEREPDCSLASSSLNLFRDLASLYRAERVKSFTPPAASPPPPVASPQPPAPTLLTPPTLDAASIANVVAAVMQAMGHAPKPPEPVIAPIPAALPPPLPALVPERRTIKQFHELDEESQLNILHAMHSRYGDALKQGGVISGEHRAAWRISYDAYDKETGANCQDRASAEGDRTGTRIKPVDIIKQDGDLVRFYEIVRKTWQR